MYDKCVSINSSRWPCALRRGRPWFRSLCMQGNASHTILKSTRTCGLLTRSSECALPHDRQANLPLVTALLNSISPGAAISESFTAQLHPDTAYGLCYNLRVLFAFVSTWSLISVFCRGRIPGVLICNDSETNNCHSFPAPQTEMLSAVPH